LQNQTKNTTRKNPWKELKFVIRELKAATTATVTKTSLENKRFRNGDYCFFLVSFIIDRARCKWTGRSAVKVNMENERFTIVCSRWHFMFHFHVGIWQTTSENCIKVRAARAARLFFLIQPIRSLFSGPVVAVTVALA